MGAQSSTQNGGSQRRIVGRSRSGSRSSRPVSVTELDENGKVDNVGPLQSDSDKPDAQLGQYIDVGSLDAELEWDVSVSPSKTESPTAVAVTDAVEPVEVVDGRGLGKEEDGI